MTYEYIAGARNPIYAWRKDVDFDYKAENQLRNVANLPFIHKHVAVMPDCHVGVGATVGTVIATKGAIVPAAVGVDIGCLDKDTEFLTPTGWKKISEYEEGDFVLSYDPEIKASYFCLPSKYIKRASLGFYHIKTKYGIDHMVSKDHKLLVYHSGRDRRYDSFSYCFAEDFVSKHHSRVLGVGDRFKTTPEKILLSEDVCVDYTNAELRVVVMTCADANIQGSAAILHFHKKRKYDRALELLDEAGIEIISHNHTIDGDKDVYNIRYRKICEKDSLSNLWNCSIDQLKVISEEVFYWDGNLENKVFYTRKKEEADFIQYAFIASGKRAVLRSDEREDGKIDYRVFAHENTTIGVKSSPRTDIQWVDCKDGWEYCFTVPSGYFLTRRNGNVVITGNCGMMALQTSLTSHDLPESLAHVRSAIEKAIPVGNSRGGEYGDIPKSNVKRARNLQDSLKKILDKNAKIDAKKFANQMGTLGGGNHFIEICLDESDKVWIMLHSGSRGTGNKIGTYFIDKAKKEMEKYFIGEYFPDKNLSYLVENTDIFDDYVEAVLWAQEYAKENRNAMMDNIMKVLYVAFPAFSIEKEAINCHHNYVEKEHHFGSNVWVTRKGAVRARETDFGIIPGSMGAKSFIVKGKGNPDSFCSCSHGAGRVMSRSEAKKRISEAEHIEATKGVECRKDQGILDESPAAYKDIDSVMAAQSDLIEVVHTLKQIVNVKG